MSVSVLSTFFLLFSEQSERCECILYRQDIPGENVPVLICAGLAGTILGYYHRRRLHRGLIRNSSKTKKNLVFLDGIRYAVFNVINVINSIRIVISSITI